MPDKRIHRGPHPEDAELFMQKNIPILCAAVADFSLLLSKDYAQKSTLKLVGDHFSLTERQRLAVMRASCSNSQLTCRSEREVPFTKITANPIAIDGYNILITIEAALSGGAIFLSRDGCMRDLSGIHRSYRKVQETVPALEIIAGFLSDINISQATWFFDSPVSNSGRLKTLMQQLAEKNNWPWQIELLTNPDKELIQTDMIIATSDSDVLDKAGRWTNLTRHIIENLQTKITPWIIDLAGP